MQQTHPSPGINFHQGKTKLFRVFSVLVEGITPSNVLFRIFRDFPQFFDRKNTRVPIARH